MKLTQYILLILITFCTLTLVAQNAPNTPASKTTQQTQKTSQNQQKNRKRTIKRTNTNQNNQQKKNQKSPSKSKTANSKNIVKRPKNSQSNTQNSTPQKQQATTPPPTENPTQTTTPKKEEKVNTALEEEVQRYLGYESPLLFRYLSIPYDININTNVQGWHIDIGFWLLLLIPIVLILGFKKRPILGVSIMLASLFLLIISTANSPITDLEFKSVAAQSADFQTYLSTTSFSDAPVGVTMAYIYQALLPIYQLFNAMVSPLSGTSDYITYPILLLLFVGFFFIINQRMKGQNLLIRGLILLIYLYFFLWYLLAGGIVWYGYLVLPIGILLTILAMSQSSQQDAFRWAKPFLLVVAGIWITFGFTKRISNINQIIHPQYINENTGRFMLDIPVSKYQRGSINERKLIGTYLRNITPALSKINREQESLVYRAGTPFSFFVRKNDQRVLADNLLTFFSSLVKKYKDQKTVTQVLKASNFKYIIVDLNAATFDQTAEGSVRKKYNMFLNFLHKNPGLELLATDRQVKTANPTRQMPVDYKVFGEVVNGGTYAIYEIK